MICWPSFPGGDRVLRELMTSKNTWEAYESSGCHGGAFPRSSSVAIASTAVSGITAEETMGWSSDGNLTTRLAHVSE